MENNDYEKNLDLIIELINKEPASGGFKEVYNKNNIKVWKKYDVSPPHSKIPNPNFFSKLLA